MKDDDPENTAEIVFICGSVGSVKLCLASAPRNRGVEFLEDRVHIAVTRWSWGVIIDPQQLFTAEKNNRMYMIIKLIRS